MRHDTGEGPDEAQSGPPTTTDWAGLRAQAAKLGITLSQLQQQQRQQKLRLEKKSQTNPPRTGAKPRAAQIQESVSEQADAGPSSR
jgi:hypothetical protein